MRPATRAALLAAALLAVALVAGPAVATEAPADELTPTTAPTSSPGDPGAAEEGAERQKIQPPLSFDDPQDLLGWFFIVALAVGGLLAGRNALKQLRGERPQADGSWRPR